MKRTKISDVAQSVGVSETSVSLVLTNKPNRISEATRKKIIEAAKAMDYVPNAFARGLVTKKSQTIGLIVPDIENGYFASLSKAISLEAEKYGYIVLLLNSNDSHELAMKQANTLFQRNVDGLVLVVSNESYHKKNVTQLKKMLSSLDIPFVLVDRDFADFKGNKVYYDNVEGGYLATKHLLDNGHRRIACITGPDDSFSSIQRLVGYKKALHEYKVPFDPSIIKEGDFRLESGMNCFKGLYQKDIDSIFCFNDMMAFGAITQIKELGLSVPEDLSIVGYDNNIVASISGAELDTISQDPESLAKEATALLIKCIDDPSISDDIKLKPSIVVRKSVKSI